MNDAFENDKQKALVIVAHPDDETVWMGGTILKYKNWTWRIISAVQVRDNVDRFLDLKKAAKEYRAHGVSNIDVETAGLTDTLHKEEIKKLNQENKLRQYFSERQEELKDFTIIFTHNKQGEYWVPNGHAQHILVYKIVSEVFKGKDIYQFCCPVHGEKPEDFTFWKEIKLNKKILNIKRSIFNSCYPTENYLWNNNDMSKEMDFEFNKGGEVFLSY